MSDRSDLERQTDHLTSVTSLPFLRFHTILCLRYMHILLEKNDYRNRCAFILLQVHIEIFEIQQNYFPCAVDRCTSNT